MDWDTLLEEANALARESFLLLPCDNRLEAVAFEGDNLFQGRNFQADHWITVRSDLLPDALAREHTWTSVIAGPRENENALILEWKQDPVGLAPEAQLLRAERFQSLPPLEGIFRYGSNRIGDWLRKIGWERDEPYRPEFPDALGARYDEYYLEASPHNHPQARAMVGGWHNFWADGDWYILCDYTPVVSDCTDRERLLEIYFREGEWLTIPRIA